MSCPLNIIATTYVLDTSRSTRNNSTYILRYLQIIIFKCEGLDSLLVVSLENNVGAIKNGQFRKTGNIGYTSYKKKNHPPPKRNATQYSLEF